jgi:rhamnulokinase
LAQCYKESVAELERLTGKRFTSMNIVGGGSQNRVLNQWTADALGIPVLAGPAEGTALGNLTAQMLAAGEIKDLQAARQLIAQSFAIETYWPRGAAD